MKDEIVFLKREIEICKCNLLAINNNFELKLRAEIPLLSKSVMDGLLDEIFILKEMRTFMLHHTYNEEYNVIQQNTNICDKKKQILIDMIKQLYVPYALHRENEIRYRFAQMMLKS